MRFAKLHGAGNDFLLFDGRAQPELEHSLGALVPLLCHRRLGVGADGVLLLLPAGERRLRLVYWNRDGSRAAFCANGTRCAARFAAERWGWPAMTLETGHAAVRAEVSGDGVVLHLPAPEVVEPWRELEAAGERVPCRYLVVGVPHLVAPVSWPDFWERELGPLAPELRGHSELPAGGANVHFVHIAPGAPVAVRSFERGVEGETLSCGSGVVACGLIAIAEGWAAAPVTLLTASGRTLVVAPEGAAPQCPVSLAGPAEWICEGQLSSELLKGLTRRRS